MQIGKYKVTSSNASRVQSSLVRVYLDGVILAEIRMGNKSNPLRAIRQWPFSTERAAFVSQLQKSGVSNLDIEEILKFPPAADVQLTK